MPVRKFVADARARAPGIVEIRPRLGKAATHRTDEDLLAMRAVTHFRVV